MLSLHCLCCVPCPHFFSATCFTATAPRSLLATAQEGRLPLIRLWDFETLQLPDVPAAFLRDPSGRGDVLAGPDPEALAQRYARLLRLQQPQYQHTQATGPYGGALRAAANALSAVAAAGATANAAAAAFKALPATGDAVCLTSVVADVASLQALEFGPCTTRSSQQLAAVGADEFNRPVLCLWDVGGVRELAESGQPRPPTLLARQVSEYPVSRMRFCPYPTEHCLLVTCGPSSIRFWRRKQQYLPASSVPLNEHARQHFTDLAFEAKYGDADNLKKRCVGSSPRWVPDVSFACLLTPC